MSFLDAEDTLRLIEDFSVCTSETQQNASAMRSEIHCLGEAEQKRLQNEAKQAAADEAQQQLERQGFPGTHVIHEQR